MASPIVVADLTTNAIEGTGDFDVMMQVVQKHIVAEYNAGRIKGPEYSQVYLGALQSTLQVATQFTLSKAKAVQETELLEKEVLKSIEDALLVQAQTALSTAQELKVDAEKLLVDAQELKVDQETLLVDQQTALLTQQVLTEVQNTLVATSTKCKLDAEFDVLEQQVLKVTAETGVLNQKKVTETAQTNGAGVSSDSITGAQIALYVAQKNGFARDAEQKAAKLFFETWNVRRTTDEATVADATNGLYDTNIGRVSTALLDGIGA
jgi:hypothetical protein